ncbi:MAG: hypothetical protein AAFQ42_00170 [Pseudomonadota bacterium]
MSTMTIDGLWPTVSPADDKPVQGTVWDGFVAAQSRRAAYRAAQYLEFYSADELRRLGLDDADIKRLKGVA